MTTAHRPPPAPRRNAAEQLQTAYQSSTTINLTVAVTDLGTSPHTQVQVLQGAGTTFRSLTGDIALLGGYDATITPGTTVTAHETGYATDPASATVTPVVGSYGGVVFGDLNGNGAQDPGEPGVANADVTLNGPFSGLAGEDGRSSHPRRPVLPGNRDLRAEPARHHEFRPSPLPRR